MRDISLVTDSCSDLSKEQAEKWGIRIIPTPVHFDEETYYDREDISLEEFYERLDDGANPSTSQISPEKFQEVFRNELQAGNEVIAICFSSKLSGIFKSAVIAKNEIGSDRVAVIDSRSASIGLGMTVIQAAEQRNNGASREEIIDTVERKSRFRQHIFAVGSLEMLKRGGRISGGKAFVGNILNIKPILHIEDGEILPLSRVRGKNKMLKYIVDQLEERCTENSVPEIVGISHSNDRKLAEKLEKRIENRHKNVARFIQGEIGAAVGAHVGSGTACLFFQGEEPAADPEVVI